MTSSPKVALITGGASGMGLAVAQSLASGGDWHIHLEDLNAERGAAAASSIGSSVPFHQTNAASYDSLASTFKQMYETQKRIDFVFANAGIAEHANFYATHDTDPPPPVAGLDPIVHIDLKSVVSTNYLALHYFRKSPDAKDKCLVMTASCGGLYPSYYSPIYTATKHGVIGFMRSIARHFWFQNMIRLNAICPGVARTNLLDAKEWANFPEEYFTPVEKIVETAIMLVDGKDEKVEVKGQLWGKAVEVSGLNHYYRDQPEHCDEAMRAVMGSTDIEMLETFDSGERRFPLRNEIPSQSKCPNLSTAITFSKNIQLFQCTKKSTQSKALEHSAGVPRCWPKAEQ